MAVCPLVVRRLYFHRTKLETGAWLWVSRHVAMKSYGQKAWWRQGTIAFFYNIAVWKEGRLMVVLSLKANVQFCLWNSSSFYSFLAYGLNFLCENRKKKWQVNIGHSIREWVLFNHVFPRTSGRWKFEQPIFKEEMLKGWRDDVEVSNWSVHNSDRTTYILVFFFF